MLAIAGAVGAAVQIGLVGPLVERFGTLRATLGAFALATLAYGAFGFVHGLAAFVVVLVLWAAGGSLLRPVLAARLADLTPPGERGTLLGFSDALDNLALIAAPVAGGAIVGAAPQLTGILPAAALAAGFLLTLRDRRLAKRLA